MTNEGKCECCKNNVVGETSYFCENCWKWITEKVTMDDIAVMVAKINHRKPNDKHAREICTYLVADNYLQGKATLKETS